VTAPATARPAAPPPSVAPDAPRDVLAVVGAGAAVLLASAPVTAVVQGGSWFVQAAIMVGLVTAVGLVPARIPAPAVVLLQGAAWLALVATLFTTEAVLGVLPGPAAVAELGGLLRQAAEQVEVGIAPVPATPGILLLTTGAIGLVAILVQAVAVGAGAPAAAGVPLLAAFAVPTALGEDLLPWWSPAAATVGFGTLLVVRAGARRRLPGGAVLVAAALGVGLLVGAAAPMIGTAGRFEAGVGGGPGGAIGLSPFTALRGQLQETAPRELFRVRGLPEPTYLRALTLREFVPELGWRAGRPDPGVPLPGAVPAPADIPGTPVSVEITNVGFRDYWLPVYGLPRAFAGLPAGTFAYDPASGTAYTSRVREQEGWTQSAVLPEPTAEALRAGGNGAEELPSVYLETRGVDPRVGALAAEVTAGADTDFDRALALADWFAGPGSEFGYSMRTAPGTGDDALVEFLTVGRVGYCEQFASAMAVMLRTLDVPARVAVGFTGGTDAGEFRSVSTADAHAWVEAWLPGQGWTLFDPTPLSDGRAIVPGYVQEARGQGGAGPDELDPRALEPVQVPSPEADAAPDVTAPADAGAPAPEASGGEGLARWPAVVAAAALLLALLPAGVRRRERDRRLAAVAAGGPGAADAGWAELLAASTDRGVAARASDTVRGSARRIVREHHLDGDAQQALREVVVAVEAAWYGVGDRSADRDGPEPGALGAAVRIVLAGIAAGSPLPLRGRLLPRSMLAGHPLRRLPAVREPDGAAATRT
jgi:transglutaminase-like putative cysteine protease